MIELSKIVYSSILCLLVSNWLKLEPLTLALLFLFLFIRKRKMFEVIKHLQVQNRKKYNSNLNMKIFATLTTVAVARKNAQKGI